MDVVAAGVCDFPLSASRPSCRGGRSGPGSVHFGGPRRDKLAYPVMGAPSPRSFFRLLGGSWNLQVVTRVINKVTTLIFAYNPN